MFTLRAILIFIIKYVLRPLPILHNNYATFIRLLYLHYKMNICPVNPTDPQLSHPFIFMEDNLLVAQELRRTLKVGQVNSWRGQSGPRWVFGSQGERIFKKT